MRKLLYFIIVLIFNSCIQYELKDKYTEHSPFNGVSFEFYDDSTFKFQEWDCDGGDILKGNFIREGNYITVLNDYYGLKEIDSVTFDSIYKSNYFKYTIFLIESKWKIGWNSIKVVEVDRNYGKINNYYQKLSAESNED